MKGTGFRCDNCATAVAVTEERSPIPEGWIVMSHLEGNPFGAHTVAELHACCWLCAETIAGARFDPGDGPIPDGVDGGVFMGPKS